MKYPKAGLCGACYHFANYWRKQTVGHKMSHLHTLEVWADRGKKMLLPDRVVKFRRKA